MLSAFENLAVIPLWDLIFQSAEHSLLQMKTTGAAGPNQALIRPSMHPPHGK